MKQHKRIRIAVNGVIPQHLHSKRCLPQRVFRNGVLTIGLLCFTGGVYAQGTSYTYNFVKGFLIGEGYTISDDKYCNLGQGEICSAYRTFYPNTTYKIVAFSDDNDVKDVDLFLSYTNGVQYTKDADPTGLAQVIIAPYTTTYLKIEWKNYQSATPRYQSTVYMIVGYK